MDKVLLKTKIKDLLTCSESEFSDTLREIRQLLNLKKKTIKLVKKKVKKVTPVTTKEITDVYDIGMKNDEHPWFFANNMLVHNSVYFSAWPVLKADVEAGNIPWDKDKVIQLYDEVCEQANASFEKFMYDVFHCPKKLSYVIAAGREIVARSGLYITKKRYATLVYDLEGERKDVDGKPGKVKAMGLDLRRSDTPVFMQEFLMEILLMVLQNYPESEILQRITEFRKQFEDMPGWEKGTPKRANKIQHYRMLEEKQGKANLPGHVRASLNWNTLKVVNGDRYSQEIVDGMKVIVCKLKDNPLGYTSIAYPTDELRIPQWFKELPFDDAAMSETIIDNKLDNLIGVLDYDLESTKQNNTFNSLFSFGD